MVVPNEHANGISQVSCMSTFSQIAACAFLLETAIGCEHANGNLASLLHITFSLGSAAWVGISFSLPQAAQLASASVFAGPYGAQGGRQRDDGGPGLARGGGGALPEEHANEISQVRDLGFVLGEWIIFR